MSPRKKQKDEDVETEVGAEEEAVEMSAAAWSPEAVSVEAEAAAETPEETAEASAIIEEQEPSAEADAAAEAPEETAEVDTTIEEQEPSAEAEAVAGNGEQMGENKMDLKALGRNLYQMGLNLGLAPDEAALLTGETKLPAFIGEEGAEEFKQGLVEAYQEMLDQRLHSLKQKLGVG